MHYCLFLSLEQFYVESLQVRRGLDRSLPLIVTWEDKVLDANDAARDRSIVPGTLLSEAKAILRGEGAIVPFLYDDYLADRNRWLDILLDFSLVIEPDSPSSAYVDLSGHPEPFFVISELVRRVTETTGLVVSAGAAKTKWVAKLGARRCDPFALSAGIPPVDLIEDAGDFLSPLPTKCLEPILSAHRDRLVFLGYRRIEQVAEAPLSALIEQFGRDATLIQQCAQGRGHVPVQPLYPGETSTARLSFPSGLENRLDLQVATRALTDRVARDLAARDRTCGRVRFSVQFESGRSAIFRRTLAKPVQSQPGLNAVVDAAMEQIRFQEPVVEMQLLAMELKKIPALQSSLLPRLDRRVREGAIESASRRLQASFGTKSIIRGSEIIIPRRERLLQVWRHATGWH